MRFTGFFIFLCRDNLSVTRVCARGPAGPDRPSDPCPSAVITVGTIGIEIDGDGFRTWEDGTYACSCNEYKNPEDQDYAYTGDAESGFYRIQSEDSLVPPDVYCDMITDDDGWTLVVWCVLGWKLLGGWFC